MFEEEPKYKIPPHKLRSRPKKQAESTLQRQIKDALRMTNCGYFFRIRNGATFDEKRGIYRSNTAEKGIPDLVGYTNEGRAAFIEVKYVERIEAKKKLTHKVKISEEQKEFLRRAHESGTLAGIAFNVEDAIAIIKSDPFKHPRHPRTFAFYQEEELHKYAEWYRERKRQITEAWRDPVFRSLNSLDDGQKAMPLPALHQEPPWPVRRSSFQMPSPSGP